MLLAETLVAYGEHAAARTALGAATARLRERAAQISRLDWRRSFLTKLPDNARTLGLARAWGIAGTEDEPGPRPA